MTFIEYCIQNEDFNPNNWEQWLEKNKKENIPEYELLGLLKEEYEDLTKKIRSINFYIFKKKHKRFISNLWTGCYVKFAFEIDLFEPHFEYGWIDIISQEQGLCKIQCDDSFGGCRALVIRNIDVMEILPHKERPLVYYKTMICGKCNNCDRSSNQLPPVNCNFFDFFNAILNKQNLDNDFIKTYNQIKSINEKNQDCNCSDCHNCQGECDHE